MWHTNCWDRTLEAAEARLFAEALWDFVCELEVEEGDYDIGLKVFDWPANSSHAGFGCEFRCSETQSHSSNQDNDEESSATPTHLSWTSHSSLQANWSRQMDNPAAATWPIVSASVCLSLLRNSAIFRLLTFSVIWYNFFCMATPFKKYNCLPGPILHKIRPE